MYSMRCSGVKPSRSNISNRASSWAVNGLLSTSWRAMASWRRLCFRASDAEISVMLHYTIKNRAYATENLTPLPAPTLGSGIYDVPSRSLNVIWGICALFPALLLRQFFNVLELGCARPAEDLGKHVCDDLDHSKPKDLMTIGKSKWKAHRRPNQHSMTTIQN